MNRSRFDIILKKRLFSGEKVAKSLPFSEVLNKIDLKEVCLG
jgi:hypothetical protein